jgi:hypothetical protein
MIVIYELMCSKLYLLYFLRLHIQVSWIRHRDLHLLTVGKMTYTSDQRFQSVHNPHTNDWALKVIFTSQPF